MGRGRAENRHNKERMKNRRKNDILVHKDTVLNIHVNTPARCSCVMCGNPRKFFGNSEQSKTMQERKIDLENTDGH